MSKIVLCKQTRAFAAQTLATTLKSLLATESDITEKKLADAWLQQLRKNSSLFPEGWYAPPPHGIGVLFGNIEKNSRHNYPTLRPESMWPKEDISLDKENGMAYLFASPVDRHSGIIGDFGLTVYFGNDPTVQAHLKHCFSIIQQIFDYIEVGKTFSEVYRYSEKIITEQGLKNGVTSTTDPAGKDIGHTVPASYIDWSEEEKLLLQNGEMHWDACKDMINKMRIFVNPIEKMTYKPGMAITLEPRLTSIDTPSLPMGSFHTIVVIHTDGSKELLTNFDGVLETIC